MGFKIPVKVYKLEFATEELNGLEVKAKSLSIRDYAKMLEIAEGFNSDSDSTPLPEDVTRLLSGFVKSLVSWNLEDDSGAPVPTTLEALEGLDTDLVFTIVMSWMEAISGVNTPLPAGSKNGVTSQEQSLGLAAISQSRAS